MKGSIQAAVQNWAGVNKSTVEYVTKGTNPLTEMYSAIKVPRVERAVLTIAWEPV